jgi:hypothetical protein
MAAASIVFVWDLVTSLFAENRQAIIHGTRGRWNGRRLRRRRMKISMRSTDSQPAAALGLHEPRSSGSRLCLWAERSIHFVRKKIKPA